MQPVAKSSGPMPPETKRIRCHGRRLRHVTLVLAVIGCVAYAAFLATYIGAYAGGSDSSGYLNSARLFSRGQVTTAQRQWPAATDGESHPKLCVPLGFRPLSSDTMVPTYPIGVPLLVVVTARAAGWDAAPQCVVVFHALAAILLMWWLGRCAGLSPVWAGTGAVLLATCPVFVFESLQLMSDVPATTWAMATVLLAWNSRRHSGWALAAGAALGVAVLIRPTNIIVALPAAIAAGLEWRKGLAFLLGGAPLAVAQMVYNQSAYGHPFASGYTDVDSLFRWQHVSWSIANYGRWLPCLLTPLGLLAVGLPWCAQKKPVWTGVLAAWAFSFFSLYAFYYHTHETWWYLRFVLPAFPAVWIAALLVASNLTHSLSRLSLPIPIPFRARVAMGLVLAIVLGTAGYFNVRLHTASAGSDERNYVEAIRWMRPQVPPSALLVAMQASGSLFYYTDFPILRWDKIQPGRFRRVEQAAAGRPVFALLMPFEEERAFTEKRLDGRWIKLGKFRAFNLWRLESGMADPEPAPVTESNTQPPASASRSRTARS
jgi:hypothetical protein